MNYIGPFLRMNSLSEKNIKNQLFYLAKESIKNIVLYSKCGITSNSKDFKIKNIPIKDINILTSISPLLCIYKRSKMKMKISSKKLSWDNEKIKKDVIISSNAYMTLSLLELAEYYRKTDYTPLKHLSDIYLSIVKKELNFFASYLRNDDGLFVDKKDITDSILNELKLEKKNGNFKFSDQALLMCAYYKYSLLTDDSTSKEYEKFSFDILNMFMNFKDQLYTLSYSELLKLSYAFNIFYKYSNNNDIKILCIDINELICDNYITKVCDYSKLTNSCLFCLNSLVLYENTNIIKFKEIHDKVYNKLINLYDKDIGIYLKNDDSKEEEYKCEELMLYFMNLLMESKYEESDKNAFIVSNIFKHQIIDSGIIPSWPDAPSLDNPEHYKNFSLKSEDLISDQNFKLVSMPCPKSNELAPIFVKSVSYNKKKQKYKQKSSNFDSRKNMFIYFLILNFIKPNYSKE